MRITDYIEVSVATYKPRFKTFFKSFETVINNDYIFSVYVNGMDDEALEFSEKVLETFGGSNVHITNIDLANNYGDRSKFLPLSLSESRIPLPGYLFTIDDDIVYPVDYFKRLLDVCVNNNGVPVGVHSATICKKRTKLANYFKERTVKHFSSHSKRHFVNMLGTGTICFSPARVPIDFDFFAKPNMADCYFALYCQKNKIPMICVDRNINWLMQLDDNSPSLWELRGDGKEQTSIINNHVSWEVFQNVGS